MKEPSKLDQIRALREASAQPAFRSASGMKVGDTVTMPDGWTRTITLVLPKLRKAAPLLAREGKCASCDRRRALLTAAKAKRRAKDAAILFHVSHETGEHHLGPRSECPQCTATVPSPSP